MKSIKAVFLTTISLSLASCDQTPKTYANNCNIPFPHWGTERDGPGHLRIINEVLISKDGVIKFNETQISDKQLIEYLNQIGQLNPLPETILEFSPNTNCDRVIEIRKIMSDAMVCSKEKAMCSEWR